MHRLIRSLVWLLGSLGICFAQNPYGLPDGLYSEITTEHGVVVCEVFFEKTPLTAASYVGLAEGTLGPRPRKPFFDHLQWHRVVPGFVIQGGDPTATGDGGPGYEFPDEIVPGLRHDSTGTLQMANDGPDTNGSQYCLMLSAQQRLNYLHTVFGHVVRGLEVLPAIRQGDTMRVKILRLGAKAKAFRADDQAFAELRAKARRYTGPKAPGPDAPFDDPDKILPTEWDRARGFTFKLANFERFTGTRIVARVFAKAPAEAVPIEAWLQRESKRLRVSKRGAFAAYFADQDRWHLQVGEESIAAFITTSPTGGKLTSGIALPEAMTATLAAASNTAAGFIAKAESTAPSEKPVTPAHRIKLKVDALLDTLIFKLEQP
jgi:cyclophilin family peptidyl-prolyl cis-trans isomerase